LAGFLLLLQVELAGPFTISTASIVCPFSHGPNATEASSVLWPKVGFASGAARSARNTFLPLPPEGAGPAGRRYDRSDPPGGIVVVRRASADKLAKIANLERWLSRFFQAACGPTARMRAPSRGFFARRASGSVA